MSKGRHKKMKPETPSHFPPNQTDSPVEMTNNRYTKPVHRRERPETQKQKERDFRPQPDSVTKGVT